MTKIRLCPDCCQPMAHGCLCVTPLCPNYAEEDAWRAWEEKQEREMERADELQDRKKNDSLLQRKRS